MAFTPSEVEMIDRLERTIMRNAGSDELMLRYYQGRQRVEQLGMAIPPNMRRFLVVANWPRVVVDTTESRQQVRSLILPGEETADPQLRAIWDANNLTAHLKMFNRDRMIYGRGFMTVSTNPANTSLPLIRVDSPREMAAVADPVTETLIAAARFYGDDDEPTGRPAYVTLYLPQATIWGERQGGRWIELQRDDHRLGAVPVVMHLNRRMSNSWQGESQMSDVIPLADAVARALTNLQFAQEAHGIPRMFMTGVAQGDFLDTDGKPIPMFEAYFDAIHMLTKENAKVGQLDAADLKNFETALSVYGKQASIVTGFPGRYFGLQTVNPPAEGAIRAEEASLIRSVESQNEEVGMTLGWVGALGLRFATGDWVEGNRVRVDWFDPATPTIAQRMDATVKAVQSGILSREGAWDELGWSEARKAKERAYFLAEQADPVLMALAQGAQADATDL